MDTQQLQAFLAVAETGSFSAAGEQLHLTQPAISKRVSGLEQLLSSRLFDRIGRQITLTQAGMALLPKARRILQEVADARQTIADLEGEIRGKLSIATSHHIGLHRLPPVLRQFTRGYPEVKLDLHFLDSEQAYEEILQGRFDLAIITLALEPDPRINADIIWRDQLRFVSAQNHSLAHKSSLDLSDISAWPAIMPDANTYTTRLVRQLFDSRQLPLEVGMISNHLDTLKMMISLELGWGVLPEIMIDAQLKVLDVTHPPLTRPLGCISHRQRSLSNASQAFLKLLKQISTP